MDNKIWLSSPHMGGTEMKYIQDAFDENWIAPLGPNVNGLEKDLETYLGKNVPVSYTHLFDPCSAPAGRAPHMYLSEFDQ